MVRPDVGARFCDARTRGVRGVAASVRCRAATACTHRPSCAVVSLQWVASFSRRVAELHARRRGASNFGLRFVLADRRHHG